jgi:Tol biopolymer transport system component
MKLQYGLHIQSSLLFSFSIFLLSCLSIGRCEAGMVRASVSETGEQSDNYSFDPSLSPDGRYVAFISSATNLVLGDTNRKVDVFVSDVQTGSIVRASVSNNGAQAIKNCINPAISGDGRFIVFESDASNLVPGDTNDDGDVFLKDLQTGDITRLSVSASGEETINNFEGTNYVFRPAISADGRTVAFMSYADRLVPGDTNEKMDIFLRHLDTGSIERVSVTASGAEGNGNSYSPSLSADGRYVAFRSEASNLIPMDTFGASDIFVKDTLTGAVQIASTSATGLLGDNNTDFDPVISADGRYVVFASFAANLMPNDKNQTSDIFIKDLKTGDIRRASVSASGEEAHNAEIITSDLPSISADGRYVAFDSKANNLVPNDTNALPNNPTTGTDVFVKDMQTGAIRRVTLSPSGKQFSGNSYMHKVSLSSDGQTVAFVSKDPDLVAGDTNGIEDIFVASDVFAGATTPLPGDVNTDGVVNVVDAVLVLQITVGLYIPQDAQRAAGDMNGDGDVNITDAVLILRKAVGI